MMDKKEYKKHVKQIVKKAVKTYLKNNITIDIPENMPEEFLIKRGVFVTLRTKKAHQLRGCIGIPTPEYPLAEALIRASISSAVNDPRFPNVKYKELESLSFEVSVMSIPELIRVNDASEYKDKIEVGKHGLIVEKSFLKGLLLPQVATEYDWSVVQFLEHTCQKAGLDKNAWRDDNTKIYSFYLFDLIEGDFK